MSNEFSEEHRFPCDECGADFRFVPDQGALVCDHCGNTHPVIAHQNDTSFLIEFDFKQALARLPADQLEEMRVTSCPNCAAQVEFAPDHHAGECPFCGTPVVVDTGLHRGVKPKALLPFSIEEKTAQNAMKTWLQKRWFAPGGLKDYARGNGRLQGIYVPYWTYDAQTGSGYRGERGTEYYETRTVQRDGKTTQERVKKVRWRRASGHVSRAFDDILILAARSLPKKFTDALAPWDLSVLKPYRPDYLAGFRAEGYQVSLEDGFTEARAHMDTIIRRDIKRDIGGDRQRIHHVDTHVSNITFKHILLPVWMAAYKYRGKSYRFVVNGQTGHVRGERPYSIWKIAFAVIVGAAFAAAMGYLIATNQ